MKPKPRICAVGMFSNEVEIQLETLSKIFLKNGFHVIKTTYKSSKLSKFFDICTFLYLKRKDYDIIHVQAHSYFNIFSVIISIFWAKIFKKKTIVMYYGGAAKSFFSSFPKIIKFIFSMVDEIIVAGSYVKEAFEDLELKVKVIPHILEINKWKYRSRFEKGRKLLWVRTLSDEYNPLLLLKVFKLLLKSNDKLKLKIIGDGPLRNEIDNYISKNSLKNIELLGRVSSSKLIDTYNWADIFINTTNVDNQPVTVLEAMTCGIPVVSTNVGGIPDIISDQENGLLSDANDVKAMAENIIKIISNDILVKNLSSNGRLFIEQEFNEKKIFDSWKTVYSNVML